MRPATGASSPGASSSRAPCPVRPSTAKASSACAADRPESPASLPPASCHTAAHLEAADQAPWSRRQEAPAHDGQVRAVLPAAVNGQRLCAAGDAGRCQGRACGQGGVRAAQAGQVRCETMQPVRSRESPTGAPATRSSGLCKWTALPGSFLLKSQDAITPACGHAWRTTAVSAPDAHALPAHACLVACSRCRLRTFRS